MNPTDDITIFVRTIDLETFAAAGAEAGLSASAVARIVTRLETRLGVKLLARTTRRLSLTQEGEIYLSHGRATPARLLPGSGWWVGCLRFRRSILASRLI